ncbi:MAG: response regulator transcription factor [Oscillospiraceae bacterium]|jgi:two-component system response regulator VanR|nr:response regulator transcription factor [Oscillospiraceae bacterium]
MAEILIVEDDFDIRELLQNYLEDAGHSVTLAEDGVEALSLFREKTFDLLLLDIMLPKIDGYAVLELVRRQSAVPVLMVAALDSEENQLRGYDLSADDYITKPFSMKILVKKIDAVLRRSARTAEPQDCIRFKNLRLDLEAYRAFVDETELILTQKEFDLLRELIQNKGKVLTRDQLLDRVWDHAYFGEDRVVDTHIKNLRKKLPAQYIETIRGVGYRIEKED